MLMTKKKENVKKEKSEPFDLEQALNKCPKPEFYKEAFIKTVDVTKIKNKSDLIKEFKKYMEMK